MTTSAALFYVPSMALTSDDKTLLAELVDDVRRRLMHVDETDRAVALRHLARALTAPVRDVERARSRERARLAVTQSGKCADCLKPFAEVAPATHGQTIDRLLCRECARELRA